MDIGAILLKGLGGIASGGALGVVGAFGTGIVDYFATKEKNKHALAVLDKQVALANAEGVNAVAIEKAKALGASYENDKAAYGGGWVDMLRGLQRPGITDWLLVVATAITIYALRQVPLTAEVWAEIAKFGVYTCLDLTAMCVSWWFGSRQLERVRRK